MNSLSFAMTVPTLNTRPPGSTGRRISEISFGAGPVAALMTGNDRKQQRKIVQHALAAGINGFDMAAMYGDGQFERKLGAALHEPGVPGKVHVATTRQTKFFPLDVYRSDHAKAARRVQFAHAGPLTPPLLAGLLA